MRRDLRLLAGGVFLSAAGDLLALTTLALVVHELTGSGLWVAGFFAATMAPAVLLAPVAGAVADRVESTRVLAHASLAQVAVAVALAFSTGSVEAVIALSALLAAGSALSQPAEFALVGALGGDRARANGVMESARYAGFAAGPLMTAGLLAVADARAALLVDALSFLAIAVAARMLHARREPARGEHAREGGGLAHLRADPVLAPTLAAAVGALLCISALITVEVFYAKDVLRAGDAGYGLLTAAWMVGMIAGAARLAERVPRRALAAGALVALGLQGAAVAIQAAWAVLPFALAAYAVGGAAHGVKNTLLRTLIAARVPGAAHGRAFAAYGAARNGAEMLALVAGGVLVGAVGPRAAIVIAGVGPVLAALVGLAALSRGRRSRLRKLRAAPSAAA